MLYNRSVFEAENQLLASAVRVISSFTSSFRSLSSSSKNPEHKMSTILIYFVIQVVNQIRHSIYKLTLLCLCGSRKKKNLREQTHV